MSGVALVTGGQQGIGFAIAQTLVDAGYGVAIASLPAADDPVVTAAIRALGKDAHYFSYNLADITGVEHLLDQVEAQLGPITTLVNNAGIGSPVRRDVLQVDPSAFDSVMNVNLRGTFFLSQAVAQRMCGQDDDRYRSIVFISSVSAEMVSIERAEYCMSKAGVAMMAQVFATRLAPRDIGVFDLRPGIIATEMTAGVKDKYTTRIEEGLVPAQRWGTPHDIAATVLPLVTGQMRFASGATIPVDGGLSIPRL